MKKAAILIIQLTLAISLFATGETEIEYFTTETEHYTVYSTESSTESAAFGYLMEEMYQVYNSILQLDENRQKLDVIVFSSEPQQKLYLQREWGISASGFYSLRSHQNSKPIAVFLTEGGSFNELKNIAHTGSYQILDSLSTSAPQWLKTGLSVYLENLSRMDSESDLVILRNENALNNYINLSSSERLTIEEIVELTDNQDLSTNEKLSCWAFIHYLLNSTDPLINRYIWDSINTLKENGSNWISTESITTNMQKDFEDYWLTWEMNNQLAEELQSSYNSEDKVKTRALLSTLQDSGIWQYYYYKGLLEYDDGLWEQCENSIISALESGAPQEEALYIIALCYWQRDMNNEAAEILKEIDTINPDLIDDDIKFLID